VKEPCFIEIYKTKREHFKISKNKQGTKKARAFFASQKKARLFLLCKKIVLNIKILFTITFLSTFER